MMESITPIVLKADEDVRPYLPRIRSEADAHRHELGFLSATAYEEASKKGRLWVAVSPTDGSCIGHLLFGGRDNTLRVTQLCVCPASRGAGIGRHLIQELRSFGEAHSKLAIIAKVAADLDANKFWDDEGFAIVRQQKGGQTRDRTINVRVCRLSTPTLFGSGPAPSRPPDLLNRPSYVTEAFVLDMNALFDLLRERSPLDAGVRNLLQAACNGRIRLYRTAEMVSELERTSEGADPLLSFVKHLPSLPSREEQSLLLLVSELRPMVFPERSLSRKNGSRDTSDLRHLAHCIASNVGTFVTGERAILRAADELYARYQLDVRSPAEFEDQAGDGVWDDAVLGGGVDTVRFASACGDDETAVRGFLVSLGVPPPKACKVVDFGAPGARKTGLLARDANGLCGVLLYERGTSFSTVEEAYAYVDESLPGYRGVVEHFVSQCCLRTPGPRVSRVELFMRPDQGHTRQVALTRGFRPVEQIDQDCRLVKAACGCAIRPTEWSRVVREFEQSTGLHLPQAMPSCKELSNTGIVFQESPDVTHTMSLFEFETMISPGFVLPPGRDGVIVPIKTDFAQELLGASAPQLRLDLYSTGAVRVLLERAYFKSPKNAKKVQQGMPVFFYVSGSGPECGMLHGIGRCTCSKVVSVEQALVEFARQGVLDESSLRKTADGKGRVHVFTFDNVRPIVRPIPMQVLRDEDIVDGANLVTLQTVDAGQMEKIMDLGGLLRA